MIKEYKITSINIEKDLLDKSKLHCEEDKRTFSNFINLLLENYFKQERIIK